MRKADPSEIHAGLVVKGNGIQRSFPQLYVLSCGASGTRTANSSCRLGHPHSLSPGMKHLQEPGSTNCSCRLQSATNSLSLDRNPLSSHSLVLQWLQKENQSRDSCSACFSGKSPGLRSRRAGLQSLFCSSLAVRSRVQARYRLCELCKISWLNQILPRVSSSCSYFYFEIC